MATPTAPVTNTKQDLLDAANELAASYSEGHALQRLGKALSAEMQRQIEFDAARSSAAVPTAASAPATTTTPTSSASSTPGAPAAAGGAGSSHA